MNENFVSTASIQLNGGKEYSHVILEIKCRYSLDPLEVQTDIYRYNTKNPSTLVPVLPSVDIESKLNGKEENIYNPQKKWYKISQDPFSLSEKFGINNTIWNYVWQETGMISVYFKVDEYTGKVARVFDKFIYLNEGHNLAYQSKCFSNQSEAVDYFKFINSEITKARRNEEIYFAKQQFIDIDSIANMYHKNSVQADRLYLGKKIKVSMKLNEIKHNDDLLTWIGYKYKSERRYSLLFGGFNIDVYTNDENFVNCSYPLVAYMEANFVYHGDNSYIFTDCKLMMTEEIE